MEVSEPTWPDAPMISRLRERDRRRVLMPIQTVGQYTPVPTELRERLDAIKANHPFPEERHD